MALFKRGFVWIVLASIIFLIIVFFLPLLFQSTYSASLPLGDPQVVSTPVVTVTHLETPEPLKALYMTACVAGTPSWRESLKKLIGTTELNAVVIDIKDFTGVVSFPNNFPKTDVGRGCTVSDMREFIGELHDADIYVIGRVSVFQDSSYTKLFPELAVKKKSDGGVWKDYKGLSFIDVGARPYWDYIVGISKEAYALGFDELNYDYVRYPSDGNMQDTSYTWTVGTSTKPEMLRSFFEYLHDGMEDSGAK